jgi:hypothetical protein
LINASFSLVIAEGGVVRKIVYVALVSCTGGIDKIGRILMDVNKTRRQKQLDVYESLRVKSPLDVPVVLMAGFSSTAFIVALLGLCLDIAVPF